MPTQEKIDEVAILKEKFGRAKNMIITDHTGLNVADVTTLRRELKKSNAELRVAKNTLFKIAAKEAGLGDLADHFSGPTSLILGYDDPSVPARIVFELQKKIEKPQVKGYVLDSRLLGAADFKKIALLPPKEQVLSILIGTLDGPIVNFVMTLEGVIRKFVGLVDALAEKRTEET